MPRTFDLSANSEKGASQPKAKLCSAWAVSQCEVIKEWNPMDILAIVAVLALWILLQVVILPRFGIST
jgi:hypothetical protein